MNRRFGYRVILPLPALLIVAGCAENLERTQHVKPEECGQLPMLACRLANYGKYEEQAWTQLPKIGIKYVFMTVPAPDQVEAARKKLTDHGLTVVVMRGETNLSQPNCVDELAVQLATCEKMKVAYMFLSPKRHGAEKPVVYDRLRQAGDVARKHGVTIVLETHPDLGTNAAVHLETMKAINHPNVRVNFDTGNITYYNKGTNAATELRKIIDYVATVEIKDHNGRFETWDFPALGQGVVDIPAVLKVLNEYGYHGPITMEIEGVQNVERSEAQTLKDIADSAAYMHSLARFR